MRLFFSAGEASGDAYGAAILSEINRIDPGDVLQVEAVGAARLQAAGAALVADSSQWGAMGILESARVYFRVLRGFNAAKHALSQGEPGWLVAIDYGYMNIRLCRFAKSKGWKVLYFAPPGSWRRDRCGDDLPKVADLVVTQFSWSRDLLAAKGAKAFWFGHPILQMAGQSSVVPGEQIAVLAGSRRHEVEVNLAPIARACDAIGLPAEFALSPTVDPSWIEGLWAGMGGGPAKFTQGQVYDVLRRSKAAIVCSGTATLEAAVCGCPCVVIYRGTKLMKLEYAIVRPKFDHISLPNILLQRRLLLELLGDAANSEAISTEIKALLAGPRREEVLAGFEELKSALGEPNAITRTAELLAEQWGPA